MLIRIPLTDTNSATTTYIDPAANHPDNGSGAFRLPDATFSLSPASMPEYDHSRYAHPATAINVVIPDGDMPAVQSWFGQTASDLVAPGDTLIKRMTDAVTLEINRFYTAASRASLFTRPFRIGWALRLSDGSHTAFTRPRLIMPDSRAPLMAIRERRLSGNTLQTLTEIITTPMTLRMSAPPFTMPEDLAHRATHLDIYATRQCSPMAGDETVRAIRTYSIYGENTPCWHYPRLAEDLVREAAASDSAFRTIGSVPIAEAQSGITGLVLPNGLKNLDNWSNYPAIDIGDADTGDNAPDPTHIRVLAGPLDLDHPEESKKIIGVTARGIFGRDADCIRMTLWRSHHRRDWKRVATTRGAHMRLLRAVRTRWVQVEITAPCGSVFDALTFEVAKA